MYKRFGIDGRLLGHSALVRSGQLSREEAIESISQPPVYDPDIVQMVKKRLGFSDAEFEGLMNLPEKTYHDFKTYKQTFERMRGLFWLLYKLDRVPKSFYMKYTAPHLRSQPYRAAAPAESTGFDRVDTQSRGCKPDLNSQNGGLTRLADRGLPRPIPHDKTTANPSRNNGDRAPVVRVGRGLPQFGL
jgi:hypothetical protein